MSMAKRRGFFLSLVVLVGALAFALGLPVERASAESGEDDLPVVLVAPLTAGVVASSPLVGEVVAETTSAVGFQAAGRIIERGVRRGQRVETGDTLARLDGRDLVARVESVRAELSQARAEERLAEQELERTRTLHERQVASDQALDQAVSRAQAARARVASTEARLTEAENALDYAELQAPFDGVVIELVADVGDVIAAGQPVVHLAADGGRFVEVAVPERRMADLPEQGTARLQSDGVETEAMLDTVNGAADPASRTFAARYRIEPREGDRPWAIGQTATLAFAAKASRYRVPVGALFARDGQQQVFHVVDGQVQAVAVTVQTIEAEHAVIEADLPEGALVVAAGVNRLHDGQRVTPRRAGEIAAGAAEVRP